MRFAMNPSGLPARTRVRDRRRAVDGVFVSQLIGERSIHLPVATGYLLERNPPIARDQLDGFCEWRPHGKNHSGSLTRRATGNDANNPAGVTSLWISSSVKQLRQHPPGRGSRGSAPSPAKVMVKRGTTAMRFSPRRNASNRPKWLPCATSG